MSDHIQVEQAGAVQIVRMNRADKKNALTSQMYLAIAGAIKAAQLDRGIRVSVITGSGDSFSAGNDLGDLAARPGAKPGLLSASTPPFQQLVEALMAADKPVIAAVNGLAVGIGVTMLLHCDLVYAADTARFTMPFVNLGIVPEAGSTLLLPRMMGRARAHELLLFGEPFDAPAALEAGIINRIFPGPELMREVIRLADRLAAKAPGAIRASKQLLRKHAPDLAAALREEGRVTSERTQSPELKEALQAFAEKRPPDFSSFD